MKNLRAGEEGLMATVEQRWRGNGAGSQERRAGKERREGRKKLREKKGYDFHTRLWR